MNTGKVRQLENSVMLQNAMTENKQQTRLIAEIEDAEQEITWY